MFRRIFFFFPNWAAPNLFPGTRIHTDGKSLLRVFVKFGNVVMAAQIITIITCWLLLLSLLGHRPSANAHSGVRREGADGAPAPDNNVSEVDTQLK